MIDNQESSGGSGLLLPALAAGGLGLGAYGLHRAGAFSGAAAEAVPQVSKRVARNMESSMRQAPFAARPAAVDSSVSEAMQRANMAGRQAANARVGLNIDPEIEAAMGPGLSARHI